MTFSTLLSIHSISWYFEIALIVFLTLMTSRYLLGENIEPDNKLYRISFVAAIWIIAVPVGIVVVFFKRHIELRRLRKTTGGL